LWTKNWDKEKTVCQAVKSETNNVDETENTVFMASEIKCELKTENEEIVETTVEEKDSDNMTDTAQSTSKNGVISQNVRDDTKLCANTTMLPSVSKLSEVTLNSSESLTSPTCESAVSSLGDNTAAASVTNSAAPIAETSKTLPSTSGSSSNDLPSYPDLCNMAECNGVEFGDLIGAAAAEIKTETFAEDKLSEEMQDKLRENNLLEHIMSTQDQIDNRLDEIESQLTELEILETNGSQKPVGEIMRDMPALKKAIHCLMKDLNKVKRMARFH